jgi:GDP-D-mannose dehydratase
MHFVVLCRSVGLLRWKERRVISGQPAGVHSECGRKAEVDLFLGDATKAITGSDGQVTFPELVRMMVDSDLELKRTKERKKIHGMGSSLPR